jgi:translocation and assembly module TamB
LSGTVNLGETEIRVPETSIGTGGDIPDIRHLNESTAERRTRLFAGLLADNGGGGGGGGRIGLDIIVNAPDRVFLRGRGLDAELGGSVRLLGSTADIIPAGRFDLIRGRLSILGTRLDLDEGSATLRGDMNPYLRLVASSGAGDYTVFITLEGPASEPTVAFSSDPGLPDDEVLAQLLFGRSVSALSPIQALQLANAATSLAGGSTNAGLLSNLREGLGLDDLDLETDAEGNAGLRAGRYLSENVYTDVTIGADGEADLSLNIDLTPDIAARGTFSSDGGSSLGVFFERDY